MIDLSRDGDVFILRMQSGENRFNPDSLTAINRALDEVEGTPGAAALVTTGEGKFYSNGLDLDFMMKNPEEGAAVGDGLGRLLERILVFPMVTVAALNGHAFAGGGILAMAHDYRIMREDRGWFCLPEVDIKIPFSQAMAQMIRARLPADTARDAMLSGRRYSAAEAVAGGIAGRAVPEAEVVPTAVALAQPLAEKDRTTMGAIKKAMFADVLPYFEKHRGGS